jgi:6-phosphogluconolactonase
MKLFLTCLLLAAFTSNAQTSRLLIGTYTNTTSDGVYVFDFNTNDVKSKMIGSAKSSNPSFLTISTNRKYLYAVNENDPGTVTAFGYQKETGALTLLNTVETKGAHPCYVSIDKKAKHLVVGNYSGGNLSVFDIKDDGSLSEAKQTIQHHGNGMNRQRQEKAHVHATVYSPDYRMLFVPDLGMDKLMMYKVDGRTGMLSPAEPPFIETVGGAGPRHMAFHPSETFMYLMEELTGTISVYEFKDNKWVTIQNPTAHPMNYKGAMGSADIHISPDGRFLYCTNRGESNTIAIFSINQATGILTPVGHQSTLGIHPRNFTIHPSGNYLLVANRDSDEVVIFRINTFTGMLTDTGERIKVPRPVCLIWAD